MEPDHLFGRFAYMKNDIPVAGCAHQAGTCRFGTDPATSVLDVDCKAHELDNLYVVDTSVFPSIGAVNPALTAMANSLRVGDHLLERLERRRWRRRSRLDRDGAAVAERGQIEIAAEISASPSSSLGGGLRSYRPTAESSSTASRPGSGRPPAAGRCSSPGRTGSRTGATSSAASGSSCRSPSRSTKRDPRARPLGHVDVGRARG